jgi:hypothetical protein
MGLADYLAQPNANRLEVLKRFAKTRLRYHPAKYAIYTFCDLLTSSVAPAESPKKAVIIDRI